MIRSTKRDSPITWLIFLLILVIGTSLRLYKLDIYGIFFDEKSTMVVSQGIVLEAANQKEVFSTRKLSIPEFWKAPALGRKRQDVLRSFTYKETFLPRATSKRAPFSE